MTFVDGILVGLLLSVVVDMATVWYIRRHRYLGFRIAQYMLPGVYF